MVRKPRCTDTINDICHQIQAGADMACQPNSASHTDAALPSDDTPFLLTNQQCQSKVSE